MIVSPKQAYLYAYNDGVKFPKDWHITKNFTWNEVFKNENLSDGIPLLEIFENALDLAEYLQILRDKLDRQIIIHSWVRQPKHNKRVSKAKLSAHINGRAADFHVVGLTMDQTRAFIRTLKLPVRIEANTATWVHMDISNYVNDYRVGLFNA